MLSYDRNFEPTFRTRSKGGRAVPIPCELSDPASVADAGDRCTQSVDGCDVLVNNAGLHAPENLFECRGMHDPGPMSGLGDDAVANVAERVGLRGEVSFFKVSFSDCH